MTSFLTLQLTVNCYRPLIRYLSHISYNTTRFMLNPTKLDPLVSCHYFSLIIRNLSEIIRPQMKRMWKNIYNTWNLWKGGGKAWYNAAIFILWWITYDTESTYMNCLFKDLFNRLLFLALFSIEKRAFRVNIVIFNA